MHNYTEGQVWRYKTRPGEEGSLLYIAKIDRFESGEVFHIALDGVRLKNKWLDGGIQTKLSHAPVNIETLNSSVTSLVRDGGPVPDISDEYSLWREPYEEGEAGVFNIPVLEILQVIEDIANNSA